MTAKRDAADLARLSALLDCALDLPAAQREAWLDGLEGDDAPLRDTLRRMLDRHAADETDALLRLPAAIGAPSAAAEAGALIGAYRLIRELGAGGMGQVWLAERADGSLKRRVALKLPHLTWSHDLTERFAREREILASLEHPHIARLYDAGLDAHGRPFMALEYVEGQPIDVYCRERALSVEQCLGVLLQVAEAVAFAHARLVLHRDLKPGNVLVTSEGQVRLLDFGVAKLMLGDTASETALTRESGRALTLDYASPEQIRGEPLGTASDVYSLGVVAFELLAGARPYRLQGQSAAALEQAVLSSEAPSASSVATDRALKRRLAGELDAILGKALKKPLAERYATVDALAQDWRNHLAGQRVAARPDTVAYRLRRLVRRYRAPLLGAATMAALLVAALGFGATAVVVLALSGGLGAALWQGRKAALDRDRALVAAQRNEAVYMFVDTLLNKAARSGEALTAQQLIDRSEQLLDAELADKPGNRATVLAMIGTSLKSLGNPVRGLQLLERAFDAARLSGDMELVDYIGLERAATLNDNGRTEEARALLEPIAARNARDPEMRSRASYYLGEMAKARNDAPGLLHHAEEALRALRLSPKRTQRMQATFVALQGYACHLDGRNDEADRHYAAAIATLESLGLGSSPNAIAHHYNWGVIRQNVGDLDRSLELLDGALAKAARAAPDAPPSPIHFGHRSRTLELMGRHPDAEASYRETLALALAQGSARMALFARLGLASTCAGRGQAAEARAWLEQARSESTLPPAAGTSAAVLEHLVEGRLALLGNDPAAAVTAFSEAMARRPPIAPTVLALVGRAEAYLALSRRDAAEADATDACELARRLQQKRPASVLTDAALAVLSRLRATSSQAVPAQATSGPIPGRNGFSGPGPRP